MVGRCFYDFDLLWCLNQLNREEFLAFKEHLQHEPQKLGFKPIQDTELREASREWVVRLVDCYYLTKRWEVTLRVSQLINREDIWIKAQDAVWKKHYPYKSHAKIKFCRVWKDETCLQVPDEFYKESVKTEYELLSQAFVDDQAGDPSLATTVVLQGMKGIGKTTLLKRAILEWAEGDLWHKRFNFVFFLDVSDLSTIPETSLVELLYRDWPTDSKPLEEIFFQPEKMLFMLDGFEGLKFSLDVDRFCTDWRKPESTPILLSSLLQKRMLPEASLLLTLGNTGKGIYLHLLQSPQYIMLAGLSEEARQMYFSHFFQTEEKAQKAFNFLRDQPKLFEQCQFPLVCWLVCSCLRWQLERGEDLNIASQNNTSLYLSYFISVFKSGMPLSTLTQRRALIKGLCATAMEGIWTHRFKFQFGELKRNGVRDCFVWSWVAIGLLRWNGQYFTFPHLSLQQFCAALFYLVMRPRDQVSPGICSMSQLVEAAVTLAPSYVLQTGLFLFGLSTERTRTLLEEAFSISMSQKVQRQITERLHGLALSTDTQVVVSFLKLFHCLFESQDEKLTTRVMNFFEDISISINNTEDLALSAFCLKGAHNLQKLHLTVKEVFSDYLGPIILSYDEKLSHWQDLCSVFTTSWNFQMLNMDNCTLDDSCLSVLWQALDQPPHKLQKLVFKNTSGLGGNIGFFKTILQNPDLTYLNLYGTKLYSSEITKLCETLRHPMCNIQQLVLRKCDITDSCCMDLADMLIWNQKLKLLSLGDNPLMDKGVQELCEGLRYPICILEVLLVNFCCLTSVACNYISQTLLCNKSLCLLDLGSNILGDEGVGSLCQALRNPSCRLQQLWMANCSLTPVSCGYLSTVLMSNTHLKTLKLRDNRIENTGVKHLCEALKHPNCKLENLGLDMCELTSACCEDLASALTVCKSLRGLNLNENRLDRDGVAVLCQALNHSDCALQMLGLNRKAFEVETQLLLKAVEEQKPHLKILRRPWDTEERKLSGVLI